ncbi:MAG: dTDP-4-dehydrorhamnose 3,5-epimerase [Planctomycetota bacterium]
MKILKTKLPGVLIFEPDVFSDDRGFFLETWRKQRYYDAGISDSFVQDNVSVSQRGTLRGLHFQHPHAQGKLVQVLSGEVMDVAVDIRLDSPTFSQSVSAILSESNHKQVYIPPGFAHGFCVISDAAIFSYKCTDYYNASAEGGVAWNDPDLGIDWPIDSPIISAKDVGYPRLKDISHDLLPHFGKTS